MSRLCDTIEPTVVDEDLLKKSIIEQATGEATEVARKEGIDYRDVVQLRLDFKNILKIENMWGFDKLTKLQLDNNIIERIENLSLLVNLSWLDLSFNNIEVIEGLDSLVHLTDLTLFNNRISTLENLENLVKLNVLSVGNNRLEHLENLLYLRRFEHLQCLNIAGNPFSSDSNYKAYAVAHIPKLMYLDFRLINDASRKSASEQYQEKILELETKETEDAQKRDELQEEKKRTDKLREALVESISDSKLYDEMIAEDPEYPKLVCLPDLDVLMTALKASFLEVTTEIVNIGLSQHVLFANEKEDFFNCLNSTNQSTKQQCLCVITDFEAYYTKTIKEAASMSMTEEKARVKKLQNEIQELFFTLMGLEMQLVDQLEEVIKEFERNMADLTSNFCEQIHSLVSTIRDKENAHNEQVQECAMVTMEKFLKNEGDIEVSEEMRTLFSDKDNLTNVVNGSHDAHLGKIDSMEDDLITRVTKQMEDLIAGVHSNEISRNRSRVAEIRNLVNHLNDALPAVSN